MLILVEIENPILFSQPIHRSGVFDSEIEIETIDDKQLSVKIPSGTQVGERLRVRGHGMPNGRGGFGDLYIEIGITIPKKLSEKQKKALAEFAGTKTSKKSWF